MSKTYLTWKEIQEDCRYLANELSDLDITCIIGVANGGMIPATLIAKQLGVNKLLSCNLKSYQEDKPRDGIHNTTDIVRINSFPGWREIKNEKLLIIDDLVDTGLTFKKIKKHLFTCDGVNTATLYNKPKSIYKPDHTVREFDNDEWIVFPWED
tara:strand:- start:221 stop:682 length:462 start_codon:yes stop_codon:yes gene_type:complete